MSPHGYRQNATIREVARHAGVSRQTVSNALNAPERLTPATLARVRASITALGYRPNETGRSLTSRLSRLIGIRIGRSAHNVAANPDPLLRRLVRTGKASGYRFVIFETDVDDDEEEIAAFDDLTARRAVDGFIITDTHVGDTRPRWLLSHGIPFAAFGSPWGEPADTHAWVDVDGHAGVGLAVDHLVAAGHRGIAFLGWSPDGAGGDARRAGWLAAMSRHELAADATAVAEADDADAGRACCARLLDEHAPSAVVCASDVLACGALGAVAAAGLSPGADVAVTGYDDSPIARLSQPGLTSLRQPLAEVATFLVERVLAQITAGVDETAPRRLLVSPELVVRESSGAWTGGRPPG